MTDGPVPAHFRLAMRRLAATVTVVTIGHGTVRAGMTASAVTSLSMDPPSLLVCVNRTASLHDALVEAGSFCVNILRVDQRDVSAAFGGALPAGERFAVGRWAELAGLPCLEGAQANIVCATAKLLHHGTHTVVIGDVTEVRLAERVSPLLYLDGAYAEAARFPA